MSDQAIQSFLAWWTTHGVRIFIVVVAALVLYRGIQLAMARIEQRMQRTLTQRRHVHTLLRVFHSSTVVTIVVIAGLMLLSELGVDIAPLIAGAGVVGLAIGLGAQTLVKDWLGDRGTLNTFEASYRGIDQPAVHYRCRGRVNRVDGEQVPLEAWGVESARRRGQIALGYRLLSLADNSDKNYGVEMNPDKAELVTFSEADKLIVISED